MDQHLDTSLDESFLKISDLKYLPWVGSQYQIQEHDHKVLVVAESVYDWDQGSEQSNNSLNKNDFTRIVVLEHGLYFLSHDTYDLKNSPTYRNLERAIYGRRDVYQTDLEKLWLSVALHQYVQRPMKNIKERPTRDDYAAGARILESLLKVLKPHLCIFLGTDWRKVEPMLKFASYDEKCSYGPIGRAYPRVLNCQLGSDRLKIIMIQHTSKFFSWEKWHAQFISKEAPEYIAHMNAHSG